MTNNPETHYDRWLSQENLSYRRVGNSNLLIVNRFLPTFSRFHFPERKLANYREEAIRHNSLQVSEVIREFGLSEDDVPAILLYPTGIQDSINPTVIPIYDNKLYDSIKLLIRHLEPSFTEFEFALREIKQLNEKQKQIEEHKKLNTLRRHELRYLKAIHYISREEIEPEKQKKMQNVIKTKDLSACSGFEQPFRGYLNQIIDLQKKYPDLEKTIQGKNAEYLRLLRLDENFSKQYNSAATKIEHIRKKIYNDAESFAREEKQKKMTSRPSPQHFKIAFTFSGKYRKQYVLPTCKALLGMGYNKEDIFYDEWHSALINGIDGSDTLQSIYFRMSDCVVVLLSPDYKERNWTGNVEWRAVKELINSGLGKRICLLSVDQVNIEGIGGLFQTQAIYKPIDKMTSKEIAEFVNDKYHNIKFGNT